MKSSLEHLAASYASIAIIGMCKNAGKTEVLNYLIKRYSNADDILGLTSIGRDGEALDQATFTKKPKIFVNQGTLIATAKKSLFLCDFTKEILYTTGIKTPMGEVVIVRALSAGYADIAGASMVQELVKVKELLYSFGASRLLIDGALSRKSLSSPILTDGIILSTGAALSKSVTRVISETVHTVRLFSLEPIEDERLKSLAEKNGENNVVVIINRDYSTATLKVISSLHCSKELIDSLAEDSSYVLINGAVTDKLLIDLLAKRQLLNKLTLIVQDPTKLLISEDALAKFLHTGASIKVLKKSPLLAVTINPTSPSGYDFNGEEFKEALQKRIPIPVINVYN